MAEVHLFGDYLNLHGHSIAARGWKRAREGRGVTPEGRGGEGKRKEENKRRQRWGEDMRIKKKEKSRGEQVTVRG